MFQYSTAGLEAVTIASPQYKNVYTYSFLHTNSRMAYHLFDRASVESLIYPVIENRTGGEKSSLILLHGFSENGLCWSRVAKAFENDYDIIMVDARGQGLSSGPERGYSQELLTQDVAGLIEVPGLQHPSLFGHSNGALTAAQVAATFPELVRAIILEDPP
jgi:pimeloyl-ACP methyl ester carboxylesterase